MKNVPSRLFLGALLTIGSAAMAAGLDTDPVVGTRESTRRNKPTDLQLRNQRRFWS